MKSAAITLVVMIFVSYVAANAQARDQHATVTVPLSFIDDALRTDNVAWVDVEKDQLVGELRSSRNWNDQQVAAFRTTLPEGTTSQWTFTEWLLANRHNAVVNVRNQNSLLLNILVPLIPWLLIFGFIWFFVFRQLRKVQKGGYTGDALRVFVVNTADPAGQTPLPPPPLS